jgi:DUF4097 and DUF4098 domain-containing protein YvlB
MTILTAILAVTFAAGMVQQNDTTFAVQPGTRLELENMSGSAVVRAWDRNAIRVQARYSAAARLRIRQRDGRVQVTAEPRGGGFRGLRVDYEITVPRTSPVHLEGINLSAIIEGVNAAVGVDNVEGTITVRGTTGPVSVASVSGGVTIENVRGNVSASTVNQGVVLRGVRGDVSAETVNGGITMQGVEARRVEASTINGLVEYSGTIVNGGHYFLGTHNGRITMTVPEQSSASFSVTTRTGQVEAAFPGSITGTGAGSLNFTLGAGGARVELESFNGTVRLVRP